MVPVAEMGPLSYFAISAADYQILVCICCHLWLWKLTSGLFMQPDVWLKAHGSNVATILSKTSNTFSALCMCFFAAFYRASWVFQVPFRKSYVANLRTLRMQLGSILRPFCTRIPNQILIDLQIFCNVRLPFWLWLSSETLGRCILEWWKPLYSVP